MNQKEFSKKVKRALSGGQPLDDLDAIMSELESAHFKERTGQNSKRRITQLDLKAEIIHCLSKRLRSTTAKKIEAALERERQQHEWFIDENQSLVRQYDIAKQQRDLLTKALKLIAP
jgi:hypothetical protein